MTNNIQLIELYCAICHHYNTTLVWEAQRQSNNFCPEFTDEECITIYLWGIIQQKFEVKAIYKFINDFYSQWFPKLPSYQAFNKRICYLADAFKILADIFLRDIGVNPEIKTYMIDSMPIIVAGAKRSSSAKVASEICNKGYCASKGLYYYGVKLHMLSQSQTHTLPIPSVMSVTPASENDLPAGKRILEDVFDIDVYADKMYKDTKWESDMLQNNNVSIFTPVKLRKGQKNLLYFDNLLSSAVSAVRQPIESFFNWLQVKTQIHLASKIRSLNGLLAFIYARISVACFSFNH
jgi:hypothetical protein